MAFVKLDCGILNSTLWDDRDAREVFITALLMALPHEFTDPAPQIEVKSLKLTGWSVPPGWYGFVHAAGVGIVRQSGIKKEHGLDALERLGNPEPDSRTPDFEGRRLVRVDGGFVVLNFIRYRERDHTAAERSKRYRERKASRVAPVTSRVASRSVTQAEAEAEAKKEKTSRPSGRATWLTPFSEVWTNAYHGNPPYGQLAKALKPLTATHPLDTVLSHWKSYVEQTDGQYASPHRFAQTFGRWAGNGHDPSGWDALIAKTEAEERHAARQD